MGVTDLSAWGSMSVFVKEDGPIKRSVFLQYLAAGQIGLHDHHIAWHRCNQLQTMFVSCALPLSMSLCVDLVPITCLSC